ncbi:GNAT family N-acetyltransferase [Oceanobacillus bengalensis]|uniref:N-acetyltransferase n=1 Tax=Oceanobacillus bengalensis TaxID=1435466 RepID=A0A494YS68_9BACI|nr:GNAT family N-acetyltransferase [Oceanobacillus bengalensis]RKQ12485.1 N-acetyltransferase [Oceanobacillus bengalensis]
MQIVELQEKNRLFEKAVKVFWEEWGNEHNYKFYEDAMIHSCSITSGIPRFYVAIEKEEIIGTYALLRNDLNSRQDLCPWLACLFVKEEYRGREIGSKLLQHSLKEAAKKGYDKLYLSTDLDGYYEKYGWRNSGVVYGVSGGHIKLYEKDTSFK